MARKIFVDFETRSHLDIGDVGAPKYADHHSTLPLMMVYGNDSGHEQWTIDLRMEYKIPPCPQKWRELVEDPDTEFHAHNAGFEIAIYDRICVKRWHWPPIAHERWHCTAARAAAANMPRSLDNVGRRLGLKDNEKKSKRGKFLIDNLSCPTKAQKTYTKPRKDEVGLSVKDEHGRVIKDINKLSEQYQDEIGNPLFELTNGKGKTYTYFFNEDKKLMAEFQRYNVQDIVAEMAVHKRLPPVHELERPLWLLDLEVNRRGIPVDLQLCLGALKVYAVEVNNAYAEIERVTDGEVTKTTQVQRLMKWINTNGGNMETLGAEQVENELAMMPPDANPKVRRALELRQLAGGTAVGKYKAALNFAQADDRCRDQILYYGATTTGRWSGRGLQPHNFKREKTLDEVFIDAVKTGDHATVEAIGEIEGKTVFDVLKGCLRGIICAPEGKKLLFSDFAGIESRVLNWLCLNETKVQLFRDGQDAYIHTALDVYETNYETIADWNGKKWKIKKEHGEKRQIGKACELGLGYGMGWKTFQLNAAKAGSLLDDAFACEVVNKWRTANPQIPEFWSRIEKACRFVIWNKKKRVDVNGLKVFWDPRGYLCIQLPSGRLLRYYQAQTHPDRSPDAKNDFEQIYYLDGGKFGKYQNGHRINTYGGKLCENIVQAISRDLLVHSMLIIQKAGIPIIFHVHDEVVTEVDENDSESFRIVHKAMETIPSWAAGLPLEAETQESRRFTK